MKKNNSKQLQENILNDLTDLRQFFLNHLEQNNWDNYDKVTKVINNVLDLKCEAYAEGVAKGIEICKDVYNKQ